MSVNFHIYKLKTLIEKDIELSRSVFQAMRDDLAPLEIVEVLDNLKKDDVISPDYYNYLFIELIIGWAKIIREFYWVGGHGLHLRGKEEEVVTFLEVAAGMSRQFYRGE